MGYSDSNMVVASLVLCMVVVGSAVDVAMAQPPCEDQCDYLCETDHYGRELPKKWITFCHYGSDDPCFCKKNKGNFSYPNPD